MVPRGLGDAVVVLVRVALAFGLAGLVVLVVAGLALVVALAAASPSCVEWCLRALVASLTVVALVGFGRLWSSR